jgi:sulfide:quinone oxidoreductase
MPTKVLIAGAGVAGLEAALALRELAGDLVEVELVSPETDFVYRPLAVAEPFRVGEARRFPVHLLTEAAGAELTRASVRSVDAERRLIVTSDGGALHYDALLLSLGARPVPGISGALTFRGPADEEAFSALLHEARAGNVARLVFALPPGTSWPLPLYELALLTAVHLADAGATVELKLVTPEERPLQLFGKEASEAVAELLELHGISLYADTTPVGFDGSSLRVLPDHRVEADRVVALPRLEGPGIEGAPSDTNGFVPTDSHGLVRGLENVYAAGDLTDFPVKQGGIAAQQADAAAESIAAAAGAEIEPRPFTPVLRGLLLTGLTPRYLRSEPGSSVRSAADTEPLWWPPAKIVGRHLAPFLASQLHITESPPPASGERVAVDVDLAAHVP